MSFMTAPTPWLNELAKGTIKTQWGDMMKSKEPAQEENEVYLRLKETHSHEVAAAFTDIAPIIAERLAIAEYALKNPQIRAVAPEILSYQEGLEIVLMDRPYLTAEQLDEVLELLKTDETMEVIH